MKNNYIFWLVPIVVSGLAIISEYSGFDLYFAHYFYDNNTHSWPYKSLFITDKLLHSWARNLVVIIGVCLLFSLIFSLFIKSLSLYRKHLTFLFIASITGPLIVALLKATTHIYTPWSLEIFGGDRPYLRLFDSVPIDSPVGYAFPGGHSSGGFTFICVYYLLQVIENRYAIHGLKFALFLGGIFAINQEIRGAHFLSHDLFSFVSCWIASWLWAYIFYYQHTQKGNHIVLINDNVKDF